MTKHFKYASGMQLVVSEMKNTRSVSVGVFISAGSEYENSKNNGISHFMEHMLFKGTTKRSAFQIADEMEKIGARINAFTSKNQTAYYTVSLDEHVESCIEVLSDILNNSVFDNKEISKEKGVVLEEIQMVEDDPEDLCFDNLSLAYYDNVGPGQSILGNALSVSSITRENLLDYHKCEYIPQNIVVSIAGNIKFENAIDIVFKYFESQNRKNSILQEKDSIVKPVFKSSIVIKPIEQANIAIAFPGISIKDNRKNALNMMSNLFGGGMSSRLFQSVREELGLVYNIYSLPLSYINSGLFCIYLGTSPKNAKEALIAIKKEILRVTENGFSADEFNKAKEQMKTNLVLGLESSYAVMKIMGQRALLNNELFDSAKELNSIISAKIEELAEVTNSILTSNTGAISYVGKELELDVKTEIF